ncbi:MAG: FtsQ-type POTRA domain-containing protein [Candidatus Desulfofervidus auxilii]|nr:FtsQ-type POTRA domain-containing protein [Candidatus Desulfofervidus auxilii]
MKRNRYRKQKNKYPFLIAILSILGLFILSFLFGMTYTSLCQLHYFKIKDIEIIGTHLISTSEILKNIKYQNKSILAISPAKIAFSLKKFPLIKDISIKRIWPNKLKIIIQERKPIALAYINQYFWLVEKNGECILIKDYLNFDLPIITGLKTEKDHYLKSALMTLSLWQKNYKYLELSEIHIDRDLGIILFTIDGNQILLGNDNFEKKLAILKKVIAKLQKERIKRLDLRDTQRIYAKLE